MIKPSRKVEVFEYVTCGNQEGIVRKFVLIILAGILLAGCSTARQATTETLIITAPEQNKALVSFVIGRFKHPISIWDRDEMVGLLMPRSILQFEVEPGEHLFLGNYGNRVIPLEADLAAGKHYIVRARVFPGVGLRFQPIRGVGIAYEQVQGWFQDYNSLQTDHEQLEGYTKDRKRYIDRFLKHYIKTMYPEYTLKPEDSYDKPLAVQAEDKSS